MKNSMKKFFNSTMLALVCALGAFAPVMQTNCETKTERQERKDKRLKRNLSFLRKIDLQRYIRGENNNREREKETQEIAQGRQRAYENGKQEKSKEYWKNIEKCLAIPAVIIVGVTTVALFGALWIDIIEKFSKYYSTTTTN